MRAFQKKDMICALQKVSEAVKHIIDNANKDSSLFVEYIARIQEIYISIGELFENESGYSSEVLDIEEICELLFNISNTTNPRTINEASITIQLYTRKLLNIANEIKVKPLVVFLPYKASMWDSMESVWEEANKDSNTIVKVIPIPYYDKNADGSLGKWHYEIDLFPDYVEVTPYTQYDIKSNHPDAIVIHNPYDGANRVTSIAPEFYCSKIRQYTERLYYIPYYLFPSKASPSLLVSPAVVYADRIIVQNEQIKNAYLSAMKEYISDDEYEGYAKRYFPYGSPKTDKALKEITNAVVPETWKKKIGYRKAVFFNTNVSLILHNGIHFIENMKRIFSIFRKFENEFVIIWREHPLTESTLKSMAQYMYNDYYELQTELLEMGGIIDDNIEPYTAMCASTCYYGAGGSLLPIYTLTGKPMMVTDYSYPNGINKETISLEKLIVSNGSRTYYNETHSNSLEIYLKYIEDFISLGERRMELLKKYSNNLDGTVGKKVFKLIYDDIV